MKADKFIASSIIIVSLAVAAMSFTIEDQNVFDPSSAAFFPAVIGAVMFLCSLAIVRRGIDPPSSAHQKVKQHESVEKSGEDTEELDMYEIELITPKEINIRLILFTGLVILFAVLMNYFNFMLISFLFLIGSMLLLSKEKKLRSFLVSAIISVACYYIFSHIFHIVFPS